MASTFNAASRIAGRAVQIEVCCVGWGLFVCVLAMLSAALVEYYRLQLFKRGRVLPGHNHGTRIVALSVFWQIPQYLLVGLSEVSFPPSPCPYLPLSLTNGENMSLRILQVPGGAGCPLEGC